MFNFFNFYFVLVKKKMTLAILVSVINFITTKYFQGSILTYTNFGNCNFINYRSALKYIPIIR